MISAGLPEARRAVVRLVRALTAATAAALALSAGPAWAGPADLDVSFNAAGSPPGLALVPLGGRLDGQGAPLLAPDGRIAVGGLLRNPSDRVFFGILETNGLAARTFGKDGALHTSTKAAGRSAATAIDPSGRLLAAGAGEKAGRVVVERLNADGSPDTTFGRDGRGRAVIDLGGTFAVPTALAVVADGILMTVDSDAGGRDFTVLKLTSDGVLDSGFGTAGVARVPFGEGFMRAPSVAYDVGVVQSTGRIFVAGAVLRGLVRDTALARLTPTGAPDDGPGAPPTASRFVQDLGQGLDDAATALVLEQPKSGFAGAVAVAGPAGVTGMAARLQPNLQLDSSFGADPTLPGVVRGGFAPDDKHFFPADVALAAKRRLVVVGRAFDPSGSLSRWGVARLSADGGFDDGFGDAGRRLFDTCANTAGHGPTGVTIAAGQRILIAGGCNQDGTLAVMRLFGTTPFSKPLDFTLSPTAEAAGHERIPLDRIDRRTSLAAILNGGAGLQSAPLRSTPLRSTPLRSTPLRSTPLRSTPLRSTPLRSTPLLSDSLAHVLLSELVLRTTTWHAVLANSRYDRSPQDGFTDVPLQTLALRDVADVPAVQELSLDEIDLNATPLRNITLAALLLYDRRLNHLPEPAGGWDAFLQGKKSCGPKGRDCSLFTLESRDVDLRSYYAQPLPLNATAVGTGADASPLALTKLRDIQMSLTPWAPLPAAGPKLAAFFTCGSSCTGSVADNQGNLKESATVGGLIAADVTPVTLGDVLLGMVPRDEIPFEKAPLRGLLDAAVLREQDLWKVSSSFGLDCDQAAGMQATFEFPGDARPVRKTAQMKVGGTPVTDPGAGEGPGFDLQKACEGHSGEVDVELDFGVEPGSVLGPDAVALKLAGDFGQTRRARAAITDDSRDDQDNHFDFTKDDVLAKKPIVTGHISGRRDVDLLTFQAKAGDLVTVTLSHLPADFDVAIFGPADSGPESAPLRSTPLRSTPLRSTPLPDSSAEPTDSSVLPPETLQDIPLRSTPLRSTSINRGTADEAASVLVRPGEEGKTFTIQVSGYDGASSDEPYVEHIKVTPGTPPPECADPAPVGSGTHGELPSAADVPDDTQTLILYNRQRMPDVAADVARLATAAEDAVAIPVDGDADIRGAYADWDASKRCSALLANEVVERINQRVDAIRAENGGLPELRHMVLVGPDAVLPEGRVRDETVLSNEIEFADEIVLDGKDNPQSRGMRDAYVNSDDVYADVDPQDEAYTVDLGVGRLIETKEQIAAQIDAYVDAHDKLVSQNASDTRPFMAPTSSSTAGYDFLEDAANVTHALLDPAVPAGGDRKLLLGGWTAQQARDELNRSNGGFTAINAHYDHFRALPGAAFTGSQPNALLHASEVQTAPESLVFSVGCHGGLNFSAKPSAGGEETLLDWPEQLAAREVSGGLEGGALSAVNRGFGYGDSIAVAYSEQVMAEFAGELGRREVTAGQALMLAKQATHADVGVGDAYVNKAIHEATFYGIPMWRISANGGVGAPVLPDAAQTASGASLAASATPETTDLNAVRTSSEFSVEPALQRRNGGRGSHWDVTGATATGGTLVENRELVVQHRPIQPKLGLDVTPRDSGGERRDAPPIHGALLEGLVSRDETGVDPVIALPTVDDSAHEEEPPAGKPFFPAALQSTTPVATAEGLDDRLTLVVGQSRSEGANEETHVQRLFEKVEGRVFRSSSPDWVRPTIRKVDAVVLDSLVAFTVETPDADAVGGAVLFRVPGNAAWRKADLARAGDDRLAGTAPLSGEAVEDAIVQVVDRAGNVGTSSFKVRGYRFTREPDGGKLDAQISRPPDHEDGFYTDTGELPRPAVFLNAEEGSGELFESSIDGAPFEPYKPPAGLSPEGDGAHVVRFRDSAERTGQKSFVLDTQPPTVVGQPTTEPTRFGWFNGPVLVQWRCADAVSGVAVCPEASSTSDGSDDGGVDLLAAEGRDITVTSGTPAIDNVGHEAFGSLSGINIDITDPGIECTIERADGRGEAVSCPDQERPTWYGDEMRVRFQCEDTLSGIAVCPRDRVITQEGQTVVDGTAVDRAGNRNSTGKVAVNIDLSDPTVAITTQDGAQFTEGSGELLTGGAGDAFSGLDPSAFGGGEKTSAVQVTYVPEPFNPEGDGPTTVLATVTCPENSTTGCTWTAPLPPGNGTWRATATAEDIVGHRGQSNTITITVRGVILL